MTDMLVNLYMERDVQDKSIFENEYVSIKRALAIDKEEICKFVKENFTEICPGWVDECASTLYRQPTSCFIAVKEKKIVGFACYDSTAKGTVGPMGVSSEFRKKGIAKSLLNNCLEAMTMEGYSYAIIGWVSSTEFYEKACGAMALPENFPGIYSRMIKHD